MLAGGRRCRLFLAVSQRSNSAAVGQQPKTFGNHCELRERLNLTFLHYIVSMHFKTVRSEVPMHVLSAL